MYVSRTLSEAHTIQSVVKIVNEGVVEGIEGIVFTSEQLAGQYAVEAAQQSGYNVDENEIWAHLEFLSNAGGKFNFSSAVNHGMKIHTKRKQ